MPRNTGTAVNDANGNNWTSVHLSTNIIIKVDNNVVGGVQEISINEARPGIKMIDEVGTDGHIDSAPNGSTNYNGSCNRVRLARTRMAEALSRGFIHVKSQRIPFDIEIHDQFADSDPANAIITTIKNVWFKGLSYTYSASDWIVYDKLEWEAEDIFSVINNNNVAGPTANGRSFPIIINPFEQQADIGNFRGALDAPGLLNAFLTG